MENYIHSHPDESEKLNDYRQMLLSAAQIQDLQDNPKSLITFMKILYIDLIGSYDELEAMEGRKNKWYGSSIAPYVYKKVIKHSEKMEQQELERNFINIANELTHQVTYELPITPEEVRQKVLVYTPTGEVIAQKQLE